MAQGKALTVHEAIKARAPDIIKALPTHIPGDKFIRTFEQALLREPKLNECTPRSVYESVCKAAADGLVLDGREAALVIFKDKAQYIPMVGGMLKRARNSGELSSIRAGVVFEEEIAQGQFNYTEGTNGELFHQPILVGPRGRPVAAYSIARMKDGSHDVCVMRADEIIAIKARSRSKDNGPWKTDELEMWKKTVLRRHCKTLPMDSDVARVFQRVDELYDLKAPVPDARPALGGVAARRLAQAKAAREEGLDADTATGEVSHPQQSGKGADQPKQQQPKGSQRREEQQPQDQAEEADYSEVDTDAPPF